MAYEYDRFDDEETGGGGFVLGLIAGAVLGAGIGMLLAPKAGSELRGQLGDAASRLRERAGEGYGKVSEMYANRRAGSTGSMGSTNQAGTDSSYQAGGAYAGGTSGLGSTTGAAGTSGYSTTSMGGQDTPATNTEF